MATICAKLTAGVDDWVEKLRMIRAPVAHSFSWEQEIRADDGRTAGDSGGVFYVFSLERHIPSRTPSKLSWRLRPTGETRGQGASKINSVALCSFSLAVAGTWRTR